MKRRKITHESRHIRLRIDLLDEILSSSQRRYPELLTALCRALELKGELPISIRTLKNDISYLEKNLDAPIHRPTKKEPRLYYTEQFSVKNVPVNEEDIDTLKNAITILRRATNLKIASEVNEIINRLENKVNTNTPDSASIVSFEEHTEADGKAYFDDLFTAIKKKVCVRVSYKPFNKEIRDWLVHPYVLKEYRNRWFLICRIGDAKSISNLRLDSITTRIKNSTNQFIENDLFDPETYFNNAIGVTIPVNEDPLLIKLKVKPISSEYIRTKPIHTSQKIIKKYKDGGLQIELKLYDNYELRSTLLGYGPAIEVLSPQSLRKKMQKLYADGLAVYK